MQHLIRAVLFAFFAVLLAVQPAAAIEGPYAGGFKAKSLGLGNLVGYLEVAVGGNEMTVEITGREDELKYITVSVDGDELSIRSSKKRRQIQGRAKDIAFFKLSVPEGTPIDIDGMIGRGVIGDLNAPIDMDVTAFKGAIGDVTAADIRIHGSGELTLGDVRDDLDIAISGAGSVEAVRARAARVDIDGSGAVKVASLTDGLTTDISGSGKVSVVDVRGPVNVVVAGSGEVRLKAGEASPLRLRIIGSGKFDFGGTAHDPDITVLGTGDVHIKAYTGAIQTRGQTDLKIGP